MLIYSSLFKQEQKILKLLSLNLVKYILLHVDTIWNGRFYKQDH